MPGARPSQYTLIAYHYLISAGFQVGNPTIPLPDWPRGGCASGLREGLSRFQELEVREPFLLEDLMEELAREA